MHDLNKTNAIQRKKKKKRLHTGTNLVGFGGFYLAKALRLKTYIYVWDVVFHLIHKVLNHENMEWKLVIFNIFSCNDEPTLKLGINYFLKMNNGYQLIIFVVDCIKIKLKVHGFDKDFNLEISISDNCDHYR